MGAIIGITSHFSTQSIQTNSNSSEQTQPFKQSELLLSTYASQNKFTNNVSFPTTTTTIKSAEEEESKEIQNYTTTSPPSDAKFILIPTKKIIFDWGSVLKELRENAPKDVFKIQSPYEEPIKKIENQFRNYLEDEIRKKVKKNPKDGISLFGEISQVENVKGKSTKQLISEYTDGILDYYDTLIENIDMLSKQNDQITNTIDLDNKHANFLISFGVIHSIIQAYKTNNCCVAESKETKKFDSFSLKCSNNNSYCKVSDVGQKARLIDVVYSLNSIDTSKLSLVEMNHFNITKEDYPHLSKLLSIQSSNRVLFFFKEYKLDLEGMEMIQIEELEKVECDLVFYAGNINPFTRIFLSGIRHSSKGINLFYHTNVSQNKSGKGSPINNQ